MIVFLLFIESEGWRDLDAPTDSFVAAYNSKGLAIQSAERRLEEALTNLFPKKKVEIIRRKEDREYADALRVSAFVDGDPYEGHTYFIMPRKVWS